MKLWGGELMGCLGLNCNEKKPGGESGIVNVT